MNIANPYSASYNDAYRRRLYLLAHMFESDRHIHALTENIRKFGVALKDRNLAEVEARHSAAASEDASEDSAPSGK